MENEGEHAVLLRDPEGLASGPVLLTPAAAWAAVRMDGENTLAEVQADLLKATGVKLPLSRLEEVHTLLADQGFLDDEHYTLRLAQARAKWRGARSRPLAHRGTSYPEDLDALTLFLESHYLEGPGTLPAAGTPDPDFRGIFSPHVDPRRGGAVYARAYHHLLAHAPQARRFVLLGTAHGALNHRLVPGDKPFETPFGTLAVDDEGVGKLLSSLGHEVLEDGHRHGPEHSLEFQALYLAHALSAAHGPAVLKNVTIVPLLIASFDDLFAGDETGATDDPAVQAATPVLEALLADAATTLIAGVDLTHLGLRFGGEPVGEEDLSDIAAADRTFLEAVTRGDSAAIWADVARDEDGRNYCGFPALWLARRLVGPAPGALLDYHADLAEQAVVSFAAGAW